MPIAGAHGAEQAHAPRVRALVEAHHAFVWRTLRRVGVPTADLDDCVQKVFLVACRYLEELAPEGERRFLVATAIRVAANERRTHSRRRRADAEELECMVAEGASPEETVGDRALLDLLLAALPLDLRTILVLFELERMTTTEIAELLSLPEGTVASRLRRGRALVKSTCKRLELLSRGDQ